MAAIQIGVGQVIKGWDEGVLQMQVGEKSRLHMTADYGYGAKGFPRYALASVPSLSLNLTSVMY